MIRILIAEEHAVIREGLKRIVAVNQDMVVAGEVTSGQKLLDEISKNHYDAVMLDASLPGKSWLDVLKELRVQRPNLPVLLLSAHADEDNAVRAFRAGASGYLTIKCAQDELITALRKVLSGGKYISPSLGEKLALDLEKGTEKPPHELLSDREYQVMGLLAHGRTVSEIAAEMSLSVKTISTYRSRILEKLNLKNNVELARYYMRFVDSRTVKCKKCGQDNPQMARFCAHCGAALGSTAEPPLTTSSSQPEPVVVQKQHVSFRKKSKWFVIAFAGVVIVVAAIAWRTKLTSPLNMGPTVVPLEVELKYDDGVAEATVSSDLGGYLVSFSPPSVPFVINKIRMYGGTYRTEKTAFEVHIWDNEQKVIYKASHPITSFPLITSDQTLRYASWVEVPTPGIRVNTDFFIHILADSTLRDGVQLGADDSTKNRHSNLTSLTLQGTYKVRDGWGNYRKDRWWFDKDKVNWMVRVVGRGP